MIEPAINKNEKIEGRMNKEFKPEIQRLITENIEFKGSIRNINELESKLDLIQSQIETMD